MNRQALFERLRLMIQTARIEPKVRRKTKPSSGARHAAGTKKPPRRNQIAAAVSGFLARLTFGTTESHQQCTDYSSSSNVFVFVVVVIDQLVALGLRLRLRRRLRRLRPRLRRPLLRLRLPPRRLLLPLRRRCVFVFVVPLPRRFVFVFFLVLGLAWRPREASRVSVSSQRPRNAGKRVDGVAQQRGVEVAGRVHSSVAVMMSFPRYN